MSDPIRVLFLGDIVGKPGRRAIREYLPDIRDEHSPSLVVANAENAAGGFGLTPPVVDEILGLGLDVLTTGNHIWDKKEIEGEIDSRPYIVRPANYPEGAPGRGYFITEASGVPVGILNLSGRVFMGLMDCPFRIGRALVDEISKSAPVIIVDIHAEATSEKQAMGWFLDGRVSAVIGTHTHVQTADARILPGGTAYISDAGMTGPSESVIGVTKEAVIARFLTQMPVRFETARRHPQLNGVMLDIDPVSGRALSISTVQRP